MVSGLKWHSTICLHSTIWKPEMLGFQISTVPNFPGIEILTAVLYCCNFRKQCQQFWRWCLNLLTTWERQTTMMKRILSTGKIRYVITYSNHLNTGLVWYSNGSFVFRCQMVWYLNGGLKIGLKEPVYGPKCSVFKWSAKSGDFTIWIPDTHTVRYLDGYCTVTIQIPCT